MEHGAETSLSPDATLEDEDPELQDLQELCIDAMFNFDESNVLCLAEAMSAKKPSMSASPSGASKPSSGPVSEACRSSSPSFKVSDMCWGATFGTLGGAKASSACTPHFTAPQRGHFKDKFCSQCREAGFYVPMSHVRVLTPELEGTFQNSKMQGIWS